ncbi:MAG: hypothetical protein HYW85_02855 [Deltaproteobacteria bacterium]|nr:hypothetical protein [Deltaproteobacteria bacterium]MBI3017755.1 hypothetical protein [Deltaproteobacteria bacterium]
MKFKLFLFLVITLGLISPKSFSANDASLAGNYRCWMFNVSGAGKRCTSPALVLKENGKYTMGSEKGTWKYEGGDLILSGSKIRGPGKMQVGANGMRVIFEYSYRGWDHVVTYLRQDMRGASAAKAKKFVEQKAEQKVIEPSRSSANVEMTSAKKDGPPVDIDVTIIFPDSGNVGWINGAAIMEEGETTGPETLANNDGKNTVTTYFRSMPSGRVYKIYVTTGFEKRYVGTVDLRNVTEDVKVKLYAK